MFCFHTYYKKVKNMIFRYKYENDIHKIKNDF